LYLDPSPAGIPIIVVVLAVLAFLVLICLLSTGKFSKQKEKGFSINFVH
jgi:hypothetical protein